MKTVTPVNGMRITASVRLRPGTYFLPDGLTIAADHVTVDGRGVQLIGPTGHGTGVTLRRRAHVSINGLALSHYYVGIAASQCHALTLRNNTVRATATVPSDTIALDIWTPLSRAYSTALLCDHVRDSVIIANDVQHNMNGIGLYDCARMKLQRNYASYAAGFGIQLNGTCDSRCEDNSADFCCRYAVAKRGRGTARHGMMGAYAVGFLIVNGANRNLFLRNYARACGDCFFLCAFEHTPSRRADDNVFEDNDGSNSAGIAFEATFARGTVFRHNRANYSKYGFWLGYSWDSVLEHNFAIGSRLAGIAVENGRHCIARGNDLQAGSHGILLWSDWAHTQYERSGPDAHTSAHWLIERNLLLRNHTGIRIAAEQNQGTEPLPAGKRSLRKHRPHDHRIAHNTIQNNRIGIELVNCDRTHMRHNTFYHNADANWRAEGCTELELAYNPGSAGGYL
jgi:parallel beta-helix repeat protein